jgi:hypothetical protein
MRRFALPLLGACSGVLLSTLAADAIEAAVRTPIGCSGGKRGCKEDLSLINAQKSADTTSMLVKECLEQKKIEEQREKIEYQKRRDQGLILRSGVSW